jgi:precorrin-2 dehydrogenase/sirohydrochlorin ferrochelatase
MVRYPIFLTLSGRAVVIIGGGAVAGRKAQPILAAGANLTVVARKIDDAVTEACKGTDTRLLEEDYHKEHLTGAVLAIAATNDNQLNKQIYNDCQNLGILCNVVDVPELCDFYVPAVVKRGDLQIAISTEGDCPAYARHLRKKLDKIFTDKHGEFLTELKAVRKRIIEKIGEPAERKELLEQMIDEKSFDIFVQDGPDKWRTYADGLIEDTNSI